MKNTRAALAVLSLATLASLAACGGGSSGPSTVLSQTAQLRIINGSPDAGPIDIHLGNNTGGTFAGGTGLVYGQITAFQNEPTVSQTIVATNAGQTSTVVSCNLPQLQNNQRYTVVIAGKVAGGGGTPTGTQCQFFQEAAFSTPTGQASVSVHHASPAAAAVGAMSIAFGSYTPGQANYQTFSSGAVATYAPISGGATAQGLAVNIIIPGATTGSGIGIYVAPQSTPTIPTATITPSLAQTGNSGTNGAGDTSNFLPYQTLINFDIYAIDGQGMNLVQLVGAFD
jgi:hypothetical protein